jgi:hypothetical protein
LAPCIAALVDFAVFRRLRDQPRLPARIGAATITANYAGAAAAQVKLRQRKYRFHFFSENLARDEIRRYLVDQMHPRRLPQRKVTRYATTPATYGNHAGKHAHAVIKESRRRKPNSPAAPQSKAREFA